MLRGLPGYAFEAHLNRLALAQSYRLAVVPWKGVASPYKYLKRGFLKGVQADIGMIADVMRTVSPLAALGQICTLRRRRVTQRANGREGE